MATWRRQSQEHIQRTVLILIRTAISISILVCFIGADLISFEMDH
jgi:hypothetical protein